jgi:hypothetical protein
LEYDFCWKNSKAEPKPNDSIALAEWYNYFIT